MRFYKISLILLIILISTGCEKVQITEKDLENDFNKINEYYLTNEIDDNFVFTYIDLSNNKVVVGLEENTVEEQTKFKENIINSDNIIFVSAKGYRDKNYYESEREENINKCLNNVLGAYISTEESVVKEELLSNIIDISNYNIEYSKVYKNQDNIYIIVKSNNFTDNPLEEHFKNTYEKYTGVIVQDYYIYLYNNNIENNLQEELNSCFK